MRRKKKTLLFFFLRTPPLAFSGGNGLVLDGHILGSKSKELAFWCLLDGRRELRDMPQGAECQC